MNIYIIDDHEIFLLGLEASLRKLNLPEARFHSFVSSEELFALLPVEVPDMIIADFHLEGGTGLEIIIRARALHRNVKAILISSTKEKVIKELCIQNNIQGYIYKSDYEKDIRFAVKAVLEGGTFFSEMENQAEVEVVQSHEKINPFSKLTKRELEIVSLLAKGMSYADIAERMNISTKTVNNHRVNITSKLGKMTLQHLITKATIWGVVKADHLYTNFEEKKTEDFGL